MGIEALGKERGLEILLGFLEGKGGAGPDYLIAVAAKNEEAVGAFRIHSQVVGFIFFVAVVEVGEIAEDADTAFGDGVKTRFRFGTP